MSCSRDIDELLPYKPDSAEDPTIGRLKRIIALKDAELNAFRELLPGLKFYPKSGILMDPEHVLYEE